MERNYIATSVEVARISNRKHGQVLRDIERLRAILPDDTSPDFRRFRHTDENGNSMRYYLLTPYALALLEVGQGKSALRWKGDRLQSALFHQIRTICLDGNIKTAPGSVVTTAEGLTTKNLP